MLFFNIAHYKKYNDLLTKYPNLNKLILYIAAARNSIHDVILTTSFDEIFKKDLDINDKLIIQLVASFIDSDTYDFSISDLKKMDKQSFYLASNLIQFYYVEEYSKAYPTDKKTHSTI